MTLVLDRVTRQVGGLTHIYETSLELAAGSLNILLGPTLAGKTSLMRLMAGLDRPTTGRLLVDGVNVTGSGVRDRSVAMVYQQFINYPSFTVYDNIASPLRRSGLARNALDQRVRAMAASLHIDGLLDRMPSELSGGQQQRTALARALVKDSDLLLLDEPLVNLDYKLREGLREELRGIFRTGTATVVYATTEPHEALMLGGDTIVVDAGRILQTGPTAHVFRNPASTRVGEVFSDPPMNMVDGTIDTDAATLGQGVRVPLAPHMKALQPGRYRFGVRANYLFVSPQDADDIAFSAQVELAEISGSETFIHVSNADFKWVAQEEGVHGFDLGQSITLYLSPRHLLVFGQDDTLVAAPEPTTPERANGPHRT